MKITAKLLRYKGACEDQVLLFNKHFPKGTTVTVARCVKVAHIFHWGWAANNLLGATARKVYDEACAPARKAYDEACAPAWKAYDGARATARKAYDEACATAFANATKVEGTIVLPPGSADCETTCLPKPAESRCEE